MPLSDEERRRGIEHFRRIGEAKAEAERDRREELMRMTPGERFLLGLRLSDAALPDYRRLLENPAFAAAEDERAAAKGRLHELWLARKRERGAR